MSIICGDLRSKTLQGQETLQEQVASLIVPASSPSMGFDRRSPCEIGRAQQKAVLGQKPGTIRCLWADRQVLRNSLQEPRGSQAIFQQISQIALQQAGELRLNFPGDLKAFEFAPGTALKMPYILQCPQADPPSGWVCRNRVGAEHSTQFS